MKQHDFREALKNRAIKPSSDSWEKLNTKLTAQENKDKGRYWLFFKVASVIIVFISVGFYFSKETEDNNNAPVIASPTLKENLKTIPGTNDLNEIEIAFRPENSTIKNQPIIDSIMAESNTVELVFSEPRKARVNSAISINEPLVSNSLTGNILITESPNSEEQTIDDEVEQLLYASKIKLTVNGQISSKKIVDANALLNSVEDDLYKDLKQKLIEKIAKKLKNPKEVVSSVEN